MARYAGAVSERVHLLASVTDVGRAGCVAACLAQVAGTDGRARVVGLGRVVSGCHLCDREKGGAAIGKTRRGKGTKCVVVVDGSGVPIGAQLASAQISEYRLAESTLNTVRVPRPGRGRPRSRLHRVIADRGYDSDPLRQRMMAHGTELIAPYRSNVRNRRFEDKRKLRRYKRRWKIERTKLLPFRLPPHHFEAFMQLALLPRQSVSSSCPIVGESQIRAGNLGAVWKLPTIEAGSFQIECSIPPDWDFDPQFPIEEDSRFH